MFIKRRGNKRERQRGDTIVEVLIATTVVSMVLAGAYVTTNKSLLATRAAQERAGALKLTESQLEQLKGLVVTTPTAVLNVAAPFCIYNQTNVVTNTTDPRCTQDTTGAATTADPKYVLSVTRTGNDFVVNTSWANVNGKQTDRMTLRYRVYQ